jgi:hypothetical protein
MAGMLVRAVTAVPLPIAEVERLLPSAERWLPGLVAAAEANGDELLAEVGFPAAGGRVSKQVEVRLGSPISIRSVTFLPLTWRATGPGRLFPSLDADIEVAPLGPSRTQVALSGRYKPPLGWVGLALDRALLHRVAEATVKDFVEKAGEEIVAMAAVAAATGTGPR